MATWRGVRLATERCRAAGILESVTTEFRVGCDLTRSAEAEARTR
jgi:hypothetical protein